MAKRTSKIKAKTPEELLIKILDHNKIHRVSVKHWRKTSDGNMLIQSSFDGIVRESSGSYGEYIKTIGKQFNLF